MEPRRRVRLGFVHGTQLSEYLARRTQQRDGSLELALGNLRIAREKGRKRAGKRRAGSWPLHDIAITNIIWCMA